MAHAEGERPLAKIVGIEFVDDEEGRRHTYDINVNTRFSGEDERV